MNDNWPFYAAFTFLGFLWLVCIVGAVQAYRARPAEIACRVRGLDHERLPFRAAVTCVPRAGNAVDTVIVRVPR